MKIYWGVIRVWYVSITCKSNGILLQYYYMNRKGRSKVSIQFLLIFRQSGDVLFFPYARRFRGYAATLPLFVKGHCHGYSSFLFSMPFAHQWLFQIDITIVQSSQDNQSPVPIWIINEDSCLLMRADEFTKSTLSLKEYIRKFSVVLLSAENFFAVSVLNGKFNEVK